MGAGRQIHGCPGNRRLEHNGIERLLPGEGFVSRAGGPLAPAAQDANAHPLLTMAEQKDLDKRHQADQREIKQLQHELRRKEKALAEAAALLIASEKIQAYWGEDTGDCPQQPIAAKPWSSLIPRWPPL